MKTYYEILEIDPKATQEEIRDQYRFLVQAWHPDKFPNPSQKGKAEEKTKEINKAYDTLGDPEKRRVYDFRNNVSGSTSTSTRPSPPETAPPSPVEKKTTTSYSAPRCQVCTQQGDLKQVKLYENIGMIVVRRPGSVKGRLCKNCIRYYFWTLTGKTMLLGWWGVISFFSNVFNVINNLFVFIGTFGMTKPRKDLTPDPSPIWVLTTLGGYFLIGSFIFFTITSFFGAAFLATQSSSKSTTSSSSYNSPQPTSTPRRLPTYTPYSSASSSNPASDCYRWSKITRSMEGRTVCVYGNVYSKNQNGTTSTRLEFSSAPNTFFIYSVNYLFPDLNRGDCVAAEAIVQVWNGQIPFMAVEDLYHCEPWMEN